MAITKKNLLLKLSKEIGRHPDFDLSVENVASFLNIDEELSKQIMLLAGCEIPEKKLDSPPQQTLTAEEKKQMIYELIKKESTLSTLKSKLNISDLEIAGIINEIKEDGNNILHVVKDGEDVFLNVGNDSLKKKGFYRIDDEPNNFTFLAISDTRLCSCYQQLGILNEIYYHAFTHGADFVLHCGDLCEGLYTNSEYKDTIFMHDTPSQREYIVNNYPQIEGMPTYFITGEHDDTHIKNGKQNIGKLVAAEREDMVYLGQRTCNVAVNKTNILMRHPKGKVAYTISYKSQRAISALRSEDKVNIILNGHWCYMDEYVQRKINEYAIPSVVANTPEMESDTPNTVGAYLIHVQTDDKGNFIKTTFERIPYYKTVKDEDYRRVKTLRLDHNNDLYQQALERRGR